MKSLLLPVDYRAGGWPIRHVVTIPVRVEIATPGFSPMMFPLESRMGLNAALV